MKEGRDNGICKAHLRDLRLSTTCPVTTTFLTVLRHPAKPTRLSIHCHGDVWISSIGRIVDFQGHSMSLKVIGRIGSTPASEGHIEVVNISSKRKEGSCLPAFIILRSFILLSYKMKTNIMPSYNGPLPAYKIRRLSVPRAVFSHKMTKIYF